MPVGVDAPKEVQEEDASISGVGKKDDAPAVGVPGVARLQVVELLLLGPIEDSDGRLRRGRSPGRMVPFVASDDVLAAFGDDCIGKLAML